jgi:hypothetical protein
MLLPFVERGKRDLARMPNGLGSEKKAAHNMLDTVNYLRTVILQDAACMIVMGREHVLFRKHPVFRSALFQQYVENMRIHLEARQTAAQPVHTRINEIHPGIGTELHDLRRQSHSNTAMIGQTQAMGVQTYNLITTLAADIAAIRADGLVTNQFMHHMSSFNGGQGQGGGYYPCGRRPLQPPPRQEQGQWTWVPSFTNPNNGPPPMHTGEPPHSPSSPSMGRATPRAPPAAPPVLPRPCLLALKQYATAEQVYLDYNSRLEPIVHGQWASQLGYSKTESKNIRRIGLLVHYAQGRKDRVHEITRDEAEIELKLAELSKEMETRGIATPSGIESMIQRIKKAEEQAKKAAEGTAALAAAAQADAMM